MANTAYVNDALVRIRDAAHMLGVSQSTIRAYERAGTLPPAMRNRANQRVYTMHDLAAIRAVIVPPLKGNPNE